MTVPGVYGNAGAFIAKLTISFILMITVLFVSNRETLARYTPYFVGALYGTFITFESPLSGMSMNPARTFDSALHASYTGTLFGSISLPQRWARWSPPTFFFEFAGISLPIGQSCITPTTSAAYSTMDI